MEYWGVVMQDPSSGAICCFTTMLIGAEHTRIVSSPHNTSETTPSSITATPAAGRGEAGSRQT
jgi:hypothetical protein